MRVKSRRQWVGETGWWGVGFALFGVVSHAER